MDAHTSHLVSYASIWVHFTHLGVQDAFTLHPAHSAGKWLVQFSSHENSLTGRPGRPSIAFSAQCEHMCALYLCRRPGRPCIAFSVQSVYMIKNVKHIWYTLLPGLNGCLLIAFGLQYKHMYALYLCGRPGRPHIAFSAHSVCIIENVKHICACLAAWDK
jgi:hypothetical protein